MDYSFFNAKRSQFTLGDESQTSPKYHFESMADRRLDAGLERPAYRGDGIDPWDLLPPELSIEKMDRLLGHYPGVEDISHQPVGSKSGKTYSDLGTGTATAQPKGVILHQTDSDTGEDTLQTYKDRITGKPDAPERHYGAQYLIDEKGKVKLVVPVGQEVYHAKGRNRDHIGIEMVGKSKRLDISEKGRNNIKGQVEKLNLPPKLKQRLLTDPKLASKLAGSGVPGGLIYEDIGAEQKRALWNLAGNLSQTHDLDTTKDFKAHEDVQAKCLGEGEASTEFLKTMSAYPAKVAALRAGLDVRRASAPPAGMDPQIWESELAAEEQLVSGEEQTLDALRADSLVEQQYDGERSEEAAKQEELRQKFYADFYGRQARIDASLSGGTKARAGAGAPTVTSAAPASSRDSAAAPARRRVDVNT